MGYSPWDSKQWDTTEQLFIYIYLSIFYIYALFILLRHCMWDLGSLTRDGTVPPAVEAWSLNHWMARELRDCMLRKTDLR